MEEDVEEVDKEIDIGEVPPTRDLVTEQAPNLSTASDFAGNSWILGG